MKAPNAGLVSADSVVHPMHIPGRILLPWRVLPQTGTIAADTNYYPFGTRMYVPGWGWGVVEDRGGDIKGPDRLDLFFRNHKQTLDWGRRTLRVKIER
jgi:3D (Asp-Asp-Asp) domain-containing protein